MAGTIQFESDSADCSGSLQRVEPVVCARWYAAYICTRHEKTVAAHAQRRSLDCFVPLYRSVRRWKDRRKELELPLFPGYVFVRMTSQDRLRVLTIPGVVHIVSFNGQPVPLPEVEIETLRTRQSTGRLQPHPYLRVGRRVHVRSGPMAGVEGILTRRRDKVRVVLSIDLIMRSVALEVDEADIEPVS